MNLHQVKLNSIVLVSLVTLLNPALGTKLNFQEHTFSDGIGPIFITAESRLHNYLFPNSQPRRAHPHIGKPVDVTFRITLLAVVDIEPQNEAIIVNANILQKWENPSFKWNILDFDNISRINVRPEMTWLPDIHVHANIETDKKYNGQLNTMNTQVILSHTGSHEWLATVTLKMSCGMDVKDYPFDTQRCPLRFGSLTLDSSNMVLNPLPVDVSQYGESPEWIFVSMGYEKVTQELPGFQGEFTDAIYTVVMRRKPLYPMTMLIFPNLILAWLTILVFLIPINAGERVMYIFTIFLAVAWYMTSNIENMPNSSQTIPLFTYFLAAKLVSLSLLCLSLCFTIVCHYVDPSITAMPQWLRHYILNQFSKCFSLDVVKRFQQWREDLELARRFDHEFVDGSSEVEQLSINVQSSDTQEPQLCEARPPPGSLWQGKEREGQNLSDIFNETDLRQLHTIIEALLQRLENLEDSKWLQREWELVAIILDQMFLHFFAFVLAITVFGCTIHIVQLDGYF